MSQTLIWFYKTVIIRINKWDSRDSITVKIMDESRGWSSSFPRLSRISRSFHASRLGHFVENLVSIPSYCSKMFLFFSFPRIGNSSVDFAGSVATTWNHGPLCPSDVVASRVQRVEKFPSLFCPLCSFSTCPCSPLSALESHPLCFVN